MKAAYIMLFGYMAIIGLPLLIILASFVNAFPELAIARIILYMLIGIASLVYGIVSIRETYIHSEKRRLDR